MDRLVYRATPQYLHRHLLKAASSKLSVEPLESQLRPAVSELLKVAEKALFGGKFSFELIKKDAVH
jgi:hypothetical protein